jgi:hypothetical protein
MSEKEAVTEKAQETAKQNCVSQKQQPEFSLTAPVGRIQFMQRTIGNQAVGRFIKSGALQGKFRIGKADDIYEKEADTAAKQVMSDINMPDGLSSQVPDRHKYMAGPPALQRACNCGGQFRLDENQEVRRLPMSFSTNDDSVVARVIDPNDLADSRPVEESSGVIEKTDEEMAQRKAANGEFPQATTPDLSQSIDGACRSGGHPLPSESQQFMETRFGHSFGAVRIHADQIAGDMAHRLQARAFTTGNHVFFAPGEFQPDRTSGKYLLAHELAHVVQQSSGGMYRNIQRSGNGGLNCPPYASYDGSRDLSSYNCAGLAHRTYDFKSLTNTKTALANGSSVACGTPCNHVGVVKHWLWEYDIRMEDSDGKEVAPTWQDFHTVGGPTDGDPVAKDSDEYYTKNGRRKVYGPGTAPSFKPVARDQALKNEPAETPMVDEKGRPLYKVRSNIKETCYCLPCPK